MNHENSKLKIMIVQIGKIGDMILTTPMFSQIKKKFPNSQLHILAVQRNVQILLDNPHVDKIYIFKKQPFYLINLLFHIYLEKYSVWIDPKDHFSRESLILAFFSRAGTKIGFNRLNSSVFNIAIPSDKQNLYKHAVQRNVQILKNIGIEHPKLSRPELYLDEGLVKEIESQYNKILNKLILLNISAGDESRYWTVNGWREVLKFTTAQGNSVLLVFHPDDYNLAEKIQNGFPQVSLFQSETINKVIAIMYFAKLIVTPDTSVVHIASAFNTPIVALYPPVEWNFNKFHPLSNWNEVIMPEKNKTIKQIQPETVISKIKMFFDGE